MSWYIKSIKSILLICLFLLSPYLQANNINITFAQNKQNNNGTVTLNITNISDQDIKLLKWNTLLETPLSANLFHIQLDKKTIPYIGRLIKRSNPSEADYMILESGDSHTVTIDLPKYYKMRSEGKYEINYRGKITSKILGSMKNTSKVFKTTEQSIVINYIPSIEKKSSFKLQKLTPNFNGCTQSKITTLHAVHSAAITIAKDATDKLNSINSPTQAERYATWFGAPSVVRQRKVTTNFNKIHDVLDSQTISFDCSTCTDDAFAYVYPSETYTIYLCSAFWAANKTGTDSQSGTLVHEIAHFTNIAATEDYEYGQSDSKALAITNPENAIFNSDNHEYFAENTPYLTMINPLNNAESINLKTDLPLSASIASTGEQDIYSFIVPISGIYTFYSSDTLDTQGALYSRDGTTLIYNDDIDESNENYNFSLTYNLFTGETYYLSVNAYEGTIGGYTLNVILPPADMTNLGTSDFVARFYHEVLGREADSAGLSDWVKRLITGESAGEDIARGFIFSDEFIEKKTDNTAYITTLYKAFFAREADSAGLNTWLNNLANGMSRSAVLDGFLHSQEFANLTNSYGIDPINTQTTRIKAFVRRFYSEVLNRSADNAGLTNWSNRLASGQSTGADIARGFIFSKEFTSRDTNDVTYIAILYKAFFGRDPDKSGFNAWIEKMNTGTSRAKVLDGFLFSQEFKNLSQAYGIIAVK